MTVTAVLMLLGTGYCDNMTSFLDDHGSDVIPLVVKDMAVMESGDGFYMSCEYIHIFVLLFVYLFVYLWFVCEK